MPWASKECNSFLSEIEVTIFFQGKKEMHVQQKKK
jgi:hypothetical protein